MKARLAVLALAVYTVALGAFAQMGVPVIAYIFYAALVIQILVHTFWLCPRCLNMACAINPRSPDFLFWKGAGKPRVDAIPMNTTFPVSLLGATLLVGLGGVWYFNQLAWLFMSVIGILLLYGYSRVACKTCVNKCVMSGRG